MSTLMHQQSRRVLLSDQSAGEQVRGYMDLLLVRQRRQVFLRILWLQTAALTSSLLVTSLVDMWLQPDTLLSRSVLWFFPLSVCGLVIHTALIQPLHQNGSRLNLAWTIEQQNPQIEERLTSTLQLTEQPGFHNSALVDAVAQQACTDARSYPKDEVLERKIRSAARLAAGCTLIFCVIVLVWNAILIPSLLNVLAPWRSRILPQLTARILPGHCHAAEGSNLEIIAEGAFLKDAELELLDGQHVVSSHRMATTQSADRAEFLFTKLTDDMTYRVRSGRFYSNAFQVTVHPIPVIHRVGATLEFPPYMQRNTVQMESISEPIAVPEGTQLTLTAEVDSSIRSATLKLAKEMPAEDQSAEQGGRRSAQWTLVATGEPVQSGHLLVRSEQGVDSQPFPLELRVTKDLPPVISVTSPELNELALQPDDQLAIPFRTSDDFGLTKVELVAQKNADAPVILPVMESLSDENAEGEAILQLDMLKAVAGDKFVVWLRTTDNRPDTSGGPQTTDSRRIILKSVENAESARQQAIQMETDSALRAIEAALQQLDQAQKQTAELTTALHEQIGKAPDDNEDNSKSEELADDRSEKIRENIRNAVDRLTPVIKDQAENPDSVLIDDSVKLSKVIDEDLHKANQKARMIGLSDHNAQRLDAANETHESLESATRKLRQVREDMQDRAQQMTMAAELDELARKQDALANRMQTQAPAPSEAQAKQKEVADKLQQLIEDNDDATAEQFRERAEKANQMAEQAANLQRQQEKLALVDPTSTTPDAKRKLLEVLADEQDAISERTRALQTQQRKPNDGIDPRNVDDVSKNETQKPGNATPPDAESLNEANSPGAAARNDRLQQAERQMKIASEQLRKEETEEAEQQAADALKTLRSAQTSKQLKSDEQTSETTPTTDASDTRQSGDPQPSEGKPSNSTQDGTSSRSTANDKAIEQTARQQERIQEAIKAVRDDRPQDAVRKLQEQIAERTAELGKSSEQLLNMPTEDEGNRQAMKDAQERLKEAARATKEAGNADSKTLEPGETEKSEKSNAEQFPGDPKSQQATTPKASGQSPEQTEKPNSEKPPEQGGKPQPASPKSSQQPEGDQDAQQKQRSNAPQTPKQSAETQQQQRSDAAKSLQKASQTLQGVCESCRNCANCRKPGGSSGGGSSGSSSGGKNAESKPGAASSSPRSSNNGSGNSQNLSSKKNTVDPGSLARTTERAHEAAREPSPEAARQVARDLNQLADKAAETSGYSGRRKPRDQQSGKAGQKQADGQPAAANSNSSSLKRGNPEGSASQQPAGATGGIPTDAELVSGPALRGPSSSNWTRSRRMLNSSVPDHQDARIPDEYRGVVQDYFEQLSRLETAPEADAEARP